MEFPKKTENMTQHIFILGNMYSVEGCTYCSVSLLCYEIDYNLRIQLRAYYPTAESLYLQNMFKNQSGVASVLLFHQLAKNLLNVCRFLHISITIMNVMNVRVDIPIERAIW